MVMAKYVDCEKAIKMFNRYFLNLQGSEAQTLVCDMKQTVLELPVADVVLVVMCKDCKHLMKDIVTEETPYGFDEDRYVFGCKKFFESSGEWVDVMLDDYCSSGERRCYKPGE